MAKRKAKAVIPAQGLASGETERKGCSRAASLMRAEAIQENNSSRQFSSHLLAEIGRMTWMGPPRSLTSIIRSASNLKKFWWSRSGVLLQHSQPTWLVPNSHLCWTLLCLPSNPFPNNTVHVLLSVHLEATACHVRNRCIRDGLFPVLIDLL